MANEDEGIVSIRTRKKKVSESRIEMVRATYGRKDENVFKLFFRILHNINSVIIPFLHYPKEGKKQGMTGLKFQHTV